MSLELDAGGVGRMSLEAHMNRRIPSVPVVLSSLALFASVGGGAAVAAYRGGRARSVRRRI
jgi:hypothetical protein